MGKVLYLPGCGPVSSQRELVKIASLLLMKEVETAFAEQGIDQGPQIVWYNDIQKYLWSLTPISAELTDLFGWKYYWRTRALDCIATRIAKGKQTNGF